MIDRIVLITAASLMDELGLIERVLSLIPQTGWVPITAVDPTIPAEGLILMWIHYGRWRDCIVIGVEELAFQEATRRWALDMQPNETMFLPRHERRLRIILGGPMFDGE